MTASGYRSYDEGTRFGSQEIREYGGRMKAPETHSRHRLSHRQQKGLPRRARFASTTRRAPALTTLRSSRRAGLQMQAKLNRLQYFRMAQAARDAFASQSGSARRSRLRRPPVGGRAQAAREADTTWPLSKVKRSQKNRFMTNAHSKTVSDSAPQKKSGRIPVYDISTKNADHRRAPSAKAVSRALTIAANAKGEALVSQNTLAFQTNQSIDSVQRRLKHLLREGFIVRTKEPNAFKGTPAGYTLQSMVR